MPRNKRMSVRRQHWNSAYWHPVVFFGNERELILGASTSHRIVAKFDFCFIVPPPLIDIGFLRRAALIDNPTDCGP